MFVYFKINRPKSEITRGKTGTFNSMNFQILPAAHKDKTTYKRCNKALLAKIYDQLNWI